MISNIGPDGSVSKTSGSFEHLGISPPRNTSQWTKIVRRDRKLTSGMIPVDESILLESEHLGMSSDERKPLQIEDYGLIGDMHTCALVGIDASIDFMCWPKFDSPSVFARVLDTTRGGGGHWSIRPTINHNVCKQSYIPSTNILQTKWISETGVTHLTDFFAVQKPEKHHGPVMVRRLECIRGQVEFNIEVYPAPGYAKPVEREYLSVHSKGPTKPPEHHGNYVGLPSLHQTLTWEKGAIEKLDIVLDVILLSGDEDEALDPKSMFKSTHETIGDEARAKVKLSEGQQMIMVLHSSKTSFGNIAIDAMRMEDETKSFWNSWARRCQFRGRNQEAVERSMLCLKLLTYQPTGAIIAAPTFSFPESIGGGRNWDYRYSWVRDSSFTVYVFLKMGYAEEAEAYINFIMARMDEWLKTLEDGNVESLPLMFTIEGGTELEELELEQFGGYKESRPVRIGNGATTHLQLDIYGELMDAIYLYNKHGKPITFDQWQSIRKMIGYLVKIWDQPDMSIWEVRGRRERFTYSKIMLWVAFDRALRLSEKRGFPLPERMEWLGIRDRVYLEVMEKCFNPKMNCFIQSEESSDVLDAAVLIAPLVFFIAPNDPRFLGTLDKMLKSPERGGLTSAGFVFRYNVEKSDDGVGGAEGTFTICTMWLVEALVRAAKYQTACQSPSSTIKHATHPHRGIDYLAKATEIFDNVTSFANHVGLFSEEIAVSGEQLGNTPQAFSHLAFVSAALNLERVRSGGVRGGDGVRWEVE